MSQTKLKRVRGWWAKATWVGALCASAIVSLPVYPADLPDEDQVEAAFLYRFAGYVQWPPDAPTGQDFTIAVLGSDGIVAELKRILPQHPLKNRPAQVRRIKGIEDLHNAQILFVGPGFNNELKSLLARVANRPVLVVTVSDHGLEDGSCVNFLVVDRHVRFEVSLTAADHAGLKVSAELLSVAVRVQGRGMHSGVLDPEIDRAPRFATASPAADTSR